MSKTKVTTSSGNVFADIGLPNPEELSVKANLVVNLQRLMKLHKLTQTEVAGRVGVDQPTVSKILRGKLDLVSVEKLLEWHAALNQEISISIQDKFTRRPAQKTKRGRVVVQSCACPA